MSLGLAGHDLFGRFAQQLANGNLSLVPFSRSFLPPPPTPSRLGEGAHTPPLAGGGVAAILAAPLHDAVLFFRIAPCNTSSYPPPILT
jgi:hypothetical protein